MLNPSRPSWDPPRQPQIHHGSCAFRPMDRRRCLCSEVTLRDPSRTIGIPNDIIMSKQALAYFVLGRATSLTKATAVRVLNVKGAALQDREFTQSMSPCAFSRLHLGRNRIRPWLRRVPVWVVLPRLRSHRSESNGAARFGGRGEGSERVTSGWCGLVARCVVEGTHIGASHASGDICRVDILLELLEGPYNLDALPCLAAPGETQRSRATRVQRSAHSATCELDVAMTRLGMTGLGLS